MATKIKLGNGNWGVKPNGVLAYNDENNIFKAIELSSSRASSGTYVAQSGLIADAEVGVPRIDWTNGVGELLLEPQSRNLFTYSEPTTDEGASGDITYESFSWDNGFTNCVRFGDNSVTRFRYGGSVSSSTQYTISAYVIMDDLSEPIVSDSISSGDFSFIISGSRVAGTSIDVGNNIYRVSGTATSGTSTLTNNGIVKYDAQSSKGFRVVGLQLEQQSYPTSYIRTEGSQVTRIADAVTGNSSLGQVINSSEGVLYVEMSALADDLSIRQISLNNGSSSVYVRIEYSNASNRLIFSTNVATFMQTFAYTITDTLKLAFKYKENDFAMWVNGTEVITDPLGGTFASGTLTKLSFDNGVGGSPFYGRIRDLRVYDTALTDAELTTLTTI